MIASPIRRVFNISTIKEWANGNKNPLLLGFWKIKDDKILLSGGRQFEPSDQAFAETVLPPLGYTMVTYNNIGNLKTR